MIILARILLVLALLVPSVANAQFTDQRTWAPTTGGTANAQTVAIANVSGPPLGVVFRAKAAAANTGALTLNVNSTGAKNVTKPSAAGPVALTGGELQVGQIFEFMYDGTNYQLVSNLNAAAAQVISSPQGYLTACPQATGATQPTGCTAGTLLPTGDVVVGSGQTVTGLVYTPAVANGNQFPIWNGTQFVNFNFVETTLTIPSSRLANTIYDVCGFNNSGTLGVGFTPAWSNSSAGAGNRGTGAGTPQIERKNGIYVNSVSMSVVNGGTTTVVPANQCTYIGTVLISGTNGVVSLSRTYGQNRVWPIFNMNNRLPIKLKAGDNTANWSSSLNTNGSLGPSNANAANNLTVLLGVPEEQVEVNYVQNMNANGSGSGSDCYNAIGVNSTSVATGRVGRQVVGIGGGSSINQTQDSLAQYTLLPNIGIWTFTALQGVTQNINARTWYGTESYMLLYANWRG